MELPSLLKRLRINAGLSVLDASKLLPISPQHLSRIENGKQKPSQALLENLIEKYKVPQEDTQLLRKALGVVEDDVYNLGQPTGGNLSQSVSNVKIDPIKTPIFYTNALFISSDNFGICIDAGQRVGPTNEVQIIARLGLSFEHALEMHNLLGEQIKAAQKKKDTEN